MINGLDNLQKAEPNQSSSIASTPKEPCKTFFFKELPISCQKQWTTISLLTTCRSMDKEQSNDRYSINQLNSLENDDYNEFNLISNQNKSEIKDCDLISDLNNKYLNKPLKRLSNRETNNGLFRLSSTKETLDKVSKKVISDELIKNNFKNKFKNDKINKLNNKFINYFHSDKQLDNLKNDNLINKNDNLINKDDNQINKNQKFYYSTNQLIKKFKNLRKNSDHQLSLKDNNLDQLSKSSISLNIEDEELNDENLIETMPEPLFTELELDELCNRSLNCSSNSSNLSNSIDCKQKSIDIKNHLNLVDKNLIDKSDNNLDNDLDNKKDIYLNDKELDYKFIKTDLIKLDNQNNNLDNKLINNNLDNKLINNNLDNNLDNNLINNLDNNLINNLDNNSINNLDNNLINNLDHKLIDKNEINDTKEQNDLKINNDKLDQLNELNKNEATKDRIDQLINNCLKNKNRTFTNLQNDQFNFEQQTDNLVEEIYFTAELGDQQKSIQTIKETIQLDFNQQPINSVEKIDNSLNSKSSNVSITKIQVYSQNSKNDTKQTIKLDNNLNDNQSNSSTESLSKFPDDGVEINKLDEYEDNKCDTEDVCCKSSVKSVDSGTSSCSVGDLTQDYLVVVAIDFGTTYSGYAFSFAREPDQIYMMRNPIESNNLTSHKTPTALLCTPNGNFHSFGVLARETYNNLNNEQASKWLYFDKFKMALHTNDGQLTKHTTIKAANGVQFKALSVFSMSLRYFRKLATEQLEQQFGSKINDSRYNNLVKYVITVPAIWNDKAKQFMRLAAYQAGIASEKKPNQLLIALEPEAASLFIRRLKLNQLIKPELTTNQQDSKQQDCLFGKCCFEKGTRYLVVDCGGGTVDITVHEIEDHKGKLKEIYYGGGAFGSINLDKQFELMLIRIFGQEFIDKYKLEYPSGFVDLMGSFEARKRTATIYNQDQLEQQTLNITLPFSFINAFKKYKNSSFDQYVKRFCSTNRDFINKDEISYCSKLGNLRLQPTCLLKLFRPITTQIVDHISEIIMNKEVNNKDKPLKYLFLVGGFAEKYVVRKTFSNCEFNEHLLNDKQIDILIDKDKINKIKKNNQDQNKSNNKFKDDKIELNSQLLKSNHKNRKSKDNSVFNFSTFSKRSLNKLIKLDYQKSIKVNNLKEQSINSQSLIQTKSDEQNIVDFNELKKKCEFLKIIIPQEISSAVLKGAVIYGLNPNSITVRRSRLTYGIGILNRFQPDIHPKSKLIIRDNVQWCNDVFDKFVMCNQVVGLNECVERSDQVDNVQFITDPNVKQCGQLILNLDQLNERSSPVDSVNSSNSNTTTNLPINNEETREILTRMEFGSTEIKIYAIDAFSLKTVEAKIDFLSH